MTQEIKLAKELELRKVSLGDIAKRESEIAEKETELLTKIEAATNAEELEGLNEESDELEKVKEELETEKSDLETKIASIEGELEEIRSKKEIIKTKNTEERGKEMKKDEAKETVNVQVREALNAYVRTRSIKNAQDKIEDAELRDGFVSTDGEVLIPVNIVYRPQTQPSDVVDLTRFVGVVPVTTASGTYPVLKRAAAVLSTVAELEENPELAKPEFITVDWKVDTYRGAIPVSRESIDDAAVDLMGIIEKNAEEQRVNTDNAKISAIFKTFTPVAVNDVDDIKTVLNVKLLLAYKREFVMSKSFYNIVDQLKDKNGRYLFQESITSPSGYTFLGRVCHIVEDTALGAEGESHAFLGDGEAAVKKFARANLGVKWVDHHIYGEYLRAGMRAGYYKVDPDAGFFLTWTGA